MTPSSDILGNMFEGEALSTVVATIAPNGMLTRCRVIQNGDETYLLPEEALSIRSTHPAALRASGAVRKIARDLLETLGMGEVAIPRALTGAPVWPQGLIG